MAVSEAKTRTILSIDKDMKKQLEELAAKEDRSFNNYVIQILKQHLASLADSDK